METRIAATTDAHNLAYARPRSDHDLMVARRQRAGMGELRLHMVRTAA